MDLQVTTRLIQDTHDRLARRYRAPIVHASDRLGPVSQLVLLLLRRDADPDLADEAFRAMTATLWRWDEALSAGGHDLRAAAARLDPAGTKAARIVRALRVIESWSSGRALNLEVLVALNDGEAIDRLRLIDGVDAAMAAEVLLRSNLHRRIVPIGNRRQRALERIGIVPRGLGADEAQEQFNAMLPTSWKPSDCQRDHWIGDMHATLCCRLSRPLCTQCPLSVICAHASGSESGMPGGRRTAAAPPRTNRAGP